MKFTVDLVVYKLDMCQCTAYIQVKRYLDRDNYTILGTYDSLKLAKEKIDADFCYNFKKKKYMKKIVCSRYYNIPYTLKDISKEELCEEEFEERK